MKLQRQTTFGGADAQPEERGNCFATCIASLLGVEVQGVPNFCGLGTDATWFQLTQAWLRERGLMLLSFGADPLAGVPGYSGAVMIASGPAPRGHRHSVLWQDGKLFHDPHPSDAGLLSADAFELVIVVDAQRFRDFVQSFPRTPCARVAASAEAPSFICTKMRLDGFP